MGYRSKWRILSRAISNVGRVIKEQLNILSHQRNANQNSSEIPYYTLVKIKKNINEHLCWRGCEVWEKAFILDMVKTCTATVEISMAVSQKIGINLPQDPAIPLLNIYPKDAHSYCKDICSAVLIVALFIIGRTWKQLRCQSTKEWIKKIWYVYTTEYYSALKTHDILKFAG